MPFRLKPDATGQMKLTISVPKVRAPRTESSVNTALEEDQHEFDPISKLFLDAMDHYAKYLEASAYDKMGGQNA